MTSCTLINHNFSSCSFWFPLSFSFPLRSFFLPGNTLNSNHGLNYLNNLHFFSIPPSFRIQSLGTGITALYLNHFPELNDHLIWYLSIETPLRQNSIRLLYLTCSELFSKSYSLCLLWENSSISLAPLPHPSPSPKKKRDGVFLVNLFS